MKSNHKKFIAAAVFAVCAVAGFGVSQNQTATPDLKLVLNIPASRLDVYEHGQRTRTYAVSAGRRAFATPVGKYRISQITWNPWWHPPRSEWARHEKPTPPGPNNPMGRIKINFAELLYLHGTMYEDDLGGVASHGCVRMADGDLIELARIIHRYRTPRVDADLLSQLEQSRAMTRDFHFKPVPLQVAYKLVEVRDGNLLIHPDVYRTRKGDLREDILATLKSSGITVSDRLKQQLTPLYKKRNVTRLTLALDSLVAASGGD
jgi:murein L,D-transpeptidase YcbB/YkuD